MHANTENFSKFVSEGTVLLVFDSLSYLNEEAYNSVHASCVKKWKVLQKILESERFIFQNLLPEF